MNLIQDMAMRNECIPPLVPWHTKDDNTKRLKINTLIFH